VFINSLWERIDESLFENLLDKNARIGRGSIKPGGRVSETLGRELHFAEVARAFSITSRLICSLSTNSCADAEMPHNNDITVMSRGLISLL